jgi:hypothetical protein
MSEATPGNAGRADYPRMVYHPDGRTRQVETAEEENALLPDGWGQKPSAVHLKPKPSPSVGYGSNDPFAVMIRNVLEQVLDERGVGRSPRTAAPEPAADAPAPARSQRR